MLAALILLRHEAAGILTEGAGDILVADELRDHLLLGPDLGELAQEQVVAGAGARLRDEHDALARLEGSRRASQRESADTGAESKHAKRAS